MNEIKNYVKGLLSTVIDKHFFDQLDGISDEILSIKGKFDNTSAIRNTVLGTIVDKLKTGVTHESIYKQAVEVARRISLKLI